MHPCRPVLLAYLFIVKQQYVTRQPTPTVWWLCVGTKPRPSTNHILFTKAIYSNLCYVEWVLGNGNMRSASRYTITACQEKVKFKVSDWT